MESSLTHRNTAATPRGDRARPRAPGLAARDAQVLALFENRRLSRALSRLREPDLESFGALAFQEFQVSKSEWALGLDVSPIEIHQRLVDGLPALALFVAAALAADSLERVLPFFGLSARTAWSMRNTRLTPALGEKALRLACVATQAAESFASLEAGRRYLQTPNFALGGAVPQELLRTAPGTTLVLADLQAQGAGAPV